MPNYGEVCREVCSAAARLGMADRAVPALRHNQGSIFSLKLLNAHEASDDVTKVTLTTPLGTLFPGLPSVVSETRPRISPRPGVFEITLALPRSPSTSGSVLEPAPAPPTAYLYCLITATDNAAPVTNANPRLVFGQPLNADSWQAQKNAGLPGGSRMATFPNTTTMINYLFAQNGSVYSSDQTWAEALLNLPVVIQQATFFAWLLPNPPDLPQNSDPVQASPCPYVYGVSILPPPSVSSMPSGRTADTS